MADETNTEPTDENSDVIIGLVSDGAHSLVVARFPTMAEAEAAYESLKEVEKATSLRIDSVVVASCDADGKVHLGKVTEHSTKRGLKWGAVSGALIGIVFPPSIIASTVAVGGIGAAVGKVRNVMGRHGLADELEKVMTPNTAGIVALVEDTAVVEIEKALAKADKIVTKAINKQVAAEIDREAKLAKESLQSS